MIILMLLFFYWQDNDIVITRINYTNKKIGNDLNGFKILQISDLHNKEFGKKESRLLKKIAKVKPDIIVITGDIIDGHKNRTNIPIAMEFIRGAVKIAPIYYVTGNHEIWSGVYEDLFNQLKDAGVTILDDKMVSLKKGESSIQLIGLQDPNFFWNQEESHASSTDRRLKSILANSQSDNILKILLTHRPELFSIYKMNKIDLAFAGHAHGGQFRIPYIMGLFAPNQGFFPKYTSGKYKDGDTTMIVSRGLGNSTIPIRIFNRPEIVVVTLVK